jgi:hypothetical protein
VTLIVSGKRGVLDVIRQERDRVQNRLDQAVRADPLPTSRRTLAARASQEAEIGAYNYLIGLFDQATFLSEAEYAEFEARMTRVRTVRDASSDQPGGPMTEGSR